MTDPARTRHCRYPERLIASLIEAERKSRELTVAQAAEIIGKDASSWYKKADGTTAFKVAEIGVLAEEWDMPDGWPFVQVQVRRRK